MRNRCRTSGSLGDERLWLTSTAIAVAGAAWGVSRRPGPEGQIAATGAGGDRPGRPLPRRDRPTSESALVRSRTARPACDTRLAYTPQVEGDCHGSGFHSLFKWSECRCNTRSDAYAAARLGRPKFGTSNSLMKAVRLSGRGLGTASGGGTQRGRGRSAYTETDPSRSFDPSSGSPRSDLVLVLMTQVTPTNHGRAERIPPRRERRDREVSGAEVDCRSRICSGRSVTESSGPTLPTWLDGPLGLF